MQKQSTFGCYHTEAAGLLPNDVHVIDLKEVTNQNTASTGCPVCLVLKQKTLNQLFLEVSLMFLACLDHARWAEFHLGILGPQE